MNRFEKFITGLSLLTGVHVAGNVEKSEKPQDMESSVAETSAENSVDKQSSRLNDAVDALPNRDLPMLRGDVLPPIPASTLEHTENKAINPFLDANHAKNFLIDELHGAKRSCADLLKNTGDFADGLIGITILPDENGTYLRLNEYDDNSIQGPMQGEEEPESIEEVEHPVSYEPEVQNDAASDDDLVLQKGWNELLDVKFTPETETMQLSPSGSLIDLLPTVTVSGRGSEISTVFIDYLQAADLARAYLKTGMPHNEIKKKLTEKLTPAKKK